MFYRHAVLLAWLLLVVAGCATPIGPRVNNTDWNCGPAIETTTFATCLGTSPRYSNLKYSGAAKPINFSEAVPSGWGNVTNLDTGESHKVSFYMGVPNEILNQSIGLDGSYSGKIDANFKWLEGKFETSQLVFHGTFKRNGRWDQGKVYWKKSGNSFTGSYQYESSPKSGKRNFPHVGKYSIASASCDRPQKLEGKFSVNHSPYALDPDSPFKIESNGNKAEFKHLRTGDRSLNVTLIDGRNVTVSNP